MLRRNSPFGNDTSSYAGSIQSNGFSIMDEASSQISNVSRPSAKSLYLQRKEYVASMNKMMDKIQYRVEHLFTCDLNGRELKSVADCVERLKVLDGMGRVWGQSMMLEARGAKLLLTDNETKEELESMALSDIVEIKAVLDSGVPNSLLTVSVKSGRKQTTTVYMFQCEDVRADYVKTDLSQALSRSREDSSISNGGLIAGHEGMENLRNAAKSERKQQKPADDPVPLWTSPDYEDNDILEPELHVPEEEEEEERSLQRFTTEEDLSPPRSYTELDRKVDILNHILSDIEIFMGQVAAVVAKNSKKKLKIRKGKAMDGMPSAAEFEVCFQKIKYALNLLGEVNGKIDTPSAPDFVHSLFSTLTFMVSHCPKGLPQTIVAPLLTPHCIRLMSEEASTEEDELWQSLGDPWNIPSTQWPEDDEDIPTYTLEFSDGWQPPEVFEAPEPVRRQGSPHPVRRQGSPHPVRRQGSPRPVRRQESPRPVRRQESPRPAPSQTAKWTPSRSPPKVREPSLRCLRVKQDFFSRNPRELTVRRGDMVELLDESKQWWKVRDSRGEEGFVPNNVLEGDDEPMEQFEGSPVLTKRSKPPDVKAWLEDKGFSKITVRCLGVLSGSMLLGMSREELKAVCPEEGGRVFFQLQAVKSAMAGDN